jgi:hypothetical protein
MGNKWAVTNTINVFGVILSSFWLLLTIVLSKPQMVNLIEELYDRNF